AGSGTTSAEKLPAMLALKDGMALPSSKPSTGLIEVRSQERPRIVVPAKFKKSDVKSTVPGVGSESDAAPALEIRTPWIHTLVKCAESRFAPAATVWPFRTTVGPL